VALTDFGIACLAMAANSVNGTLGREQNPEPFNIYEVGSIISLYPSLLILVLNYLMN